MRKEKKTITEIKGKDNRKIITTIIKMNRDKYQRFHALCSNLNIYTHETNV